MLLFNLKQTYLYEVFPHSRTCYKKTNTKKSTKEDSAKQ